jgi:hypothetical protein
LTVLTHAKFHLESPDEMGEAEIVAFTLANAYPARRGNERRQPIEILGEALPPDGPSFSTLGSGAAAAGVSAVSSRTANIMSRGARAAPLPIRTNLDGSYELTARDIATSLEHNFEAAGWMDPTRRD